MDKETKRVIDGLSDTALSSLAVLAKAEKLDHELRLNLYTQFVRELFDDSSRRPALQALVKIIQDKAGQRVKYRDDETGEWKNLINDMTLEPVEYTDAAEWLSNPKDYQYIWRAGKYAESVKMFRALFRSDAL
jgi:hypothetical protein